MDDALALEAPLEIRLNGEPFTVTMRTPGEDRLLVRGLLHTEGILAPDARVEWNESTPGEQHDVAVIEARTEAAAVLRDFTGDRTLVATTSCGLCGRTQFREDEIVGGCPLVLPRGERIEHALFPGMLEAMRRGQRTFDESGGVHAAALFDHGGGLLALFEDVGRHNAVDKLVGWMLTQGVAPEAAAIGVSGRISYEIVIKAWRARVPVLIAVSAPTSLAVRTGERLGLTIAGFCRDGRATVYT